MLLHFHVGRIPFTLNIGKRPEDRERTEKDLALVWYALHFPHEGQPPATFCADGPGAHDEHDKA